MRVLLVGDWPPPQGGVAVHVQQLHAFLGSRGVESRVLDIGKGGGRAPGVEPVRSPVRLGVRLARLLPEGWLPHLHTSGNNPRSWMLVALVGAFVPRTPRVVTLHSGLLPDFLEGSLQRRAFARAALGGYARVIAVSEAVREALLRSGVPEEKVLVQPAFCASQVRPGPVPRGVEEARARRRPLLAMAHHPSPVYGRRLMFQALRLLAERLPRVGLALFGPGTGSAALVEEARAAGVERLLEDCGELAHEQALGLLSRSDVFIRPTTHDGDALSVREALALGVPCVASDVCVRPAGTSTFRAGHAEELAARVLEVLERGPVATVESPDAGPLLLALYLELASNMARRRDACGTATSWM